MFNKYIVTQNSMSKKIIVAEIFSSIQGEGPTMGHPAIFLRLGGCNLLCGGHGTEKYQQLHNGAKWRCDTIEVWRSGKGKDIEQLAIELIATYDLLERMSKGWRFVITGGEPLMQSEAICELLRRLAHSYNINVFKGFFPYHQVEIETNGTIYDTYTDVLAAHNIQFNVSPKLASSGELIGLRFRPIELSNLIKKSNTFFKFVIADLHDLNEVLAYYAELITYSREKIYLMPAASDIQTLQANSLWLVNTCMQHNFKFSSRLQVAIWDKTTGV